ncbi:MAG: ATP-binding protein [Sulfolobus sp.]|nr:ATP-binding protein [Sulfolobus sp.]
MFIGYVVGESTTSSANVLMKNKVREGSYVTLEYEDVKALGLLTSLTVGSDVVDKDINDIILLDDLAKVNRDRIPKFVKGKIKLLVDLNGLRRIDLPPPPLTEVRLATDEELRAVYSRGNLSIGKVLGSNVPATIDINGLTRHLAILAATGAGKSNTVAVLSTRLAELGATVVIFDYHGEYSSLNTKRLNLIEPKLNPLRFSTKEFATLLNIRENAHIQYRILRRAFNDVKEEITNQQKSGKLDLKNVQENLKNLFLEKINNQATKEKDNDKSLAEVKNKIEEFFDEYGDFIDVSLEDVMDLISPARVNVVDLSPLDEDVMDAIVSHYLRKFLTSRKEHKRTGKGFKYPLLTVIEEAHVLLSKDRNTLTKHWAAKIAREGRKFGVILTVVSQRPKGLDENILSQMLNKIILRLVEPTDKKYVLETSDNLTEDLVQGLSSFNPGEALVIGPSVKLPMMVKIDKYEGNLAGKDPNLIEEWNRAKEEELIGKEALEW